MTDTEIQVTEVDLSTVITQKVGQCTNLEVRLAALSRILEERNARIVELEDKLISLNGKEPVYAKGRKEEVSLHN